MKTSFFASVTSVLLLSACASSSNVPSKDESQIRTVLDRAIYTTTNTHDYVTGLTNMPNDLTVCQPGDDMQAHCNKVSAVGLDVPCQCGIEDPTIYYINDYRIDCIKIGDKTATVVAIFNSVAEGDKSFIKIRFNKQTLQRTFLLFKINDKWKIAASDFACFEEEASPYYYLKWAKENSKKLSEKEKELVDINVKKFKKIIDR
jgi:hypothetical protein